MTIISECCSKGAGMKTMEIVSQSSCEMQRWEKELQVHVLGQVAQPLEQLGVWAPKTSQFPLILPSRLNP